MAREKHPFGARVEYPGSIPMLVVDLDLGRGTRLCAWRTARGETRERDFRVDALLPARDRSPRRP